MKKVRVNLTDLYYDILIEKNIINSVGKIIKNNFSFNKVLIVTDDNVYRLYSKKISHSLDKESISYCFSVFNNGEENKNIDTIATIYKTLAENKIMRGDLIIALGGGVVGDMAGFAASTWMRGVKFIQIPTTLLSAVDSSVGGKTAIDIKEGKNLVGTFYQPSLVLIDTATLETLSDREFNSGMGEVIKHATLFSEEFFSFLETNNSREKIMENIDYVVEKNCSLKSYIVEIDQKEHCERMFLNFGHTLAHALETSSGYGFYKHGEAVAIGMVFAVSLGIKFGITESDVLNRLKKLIKSFNLEIGFDKNTNAENYIAIDKKADRDSVNFVFIEAIGKAKIEKIETKKLIELIQLVNSVV